MSNTIDSRLIGDTIRTLRLSRHWTQEYLASRMYIDTRHLRRIEKDGTDRITVINAFAEAFGISAMDILNGCFYFYIKKDIGDLRHTVFTTICYSHTSTAG
ncbi:MAG: helix-turn-helix transcriptional regulator [Erysipelotrichaceae bacterium]|nr:helix-turn-helix transcriptional regulator [Erysipelotrichaceae bacterium]